MSESAIASGFEMWKIFRHFFTGRKAISVLSSGSYSWTITYNVGGIKALPPLMETPIVTNQKRQQAIWLNRQTQDIFAFNDS
jgi:hypothetical protein